MIARMGSLLCGLFLLGQVALATDDNFSLVFALKPDSAQNVRSVQAYTVNGQSHVNNVQLPFPLTLRQSAYQVEKIYPLEVFRHAVLKAKFEEHLGGRLYAAKVKVNAPYRSYSVYQQIAVELDRSEVLFATPSARVSIPESDMLVVPVGTSVDNRVAASSHPASAASSMVIIDPLYEKGYNIQMIRADFAWEKTLGTRLPLLAIVDTGTYLKHEELDGNGFVNTDEIPHNGLDDDQNGLVDDYNTGYAVVGGEVSSEGDDVQGHGTAVSSIACAKLNGVGLVGVAPECRIVPVRFLDKWGGGTYEDSIVALGLAIEIIATKSQSTPFKGWINNSWGGGYIEKFAGVFKILFDLAYENGIGISCAAGNNGNNNDEARFLPASVPSRSNLSIAAIDKDGRISYFSNVGPATVHNGAPGTGIYFAKPPFTTSKSEYYGIGNGTSFSSPLYGGGAILISGVFPEASVDEIVGRLILSSKRTKPLFKAFIISGQLDLYNALKEDLIPPSDISWASPLTVYHNQASFAWQNGSDDFNNPRGQLTSAVYLELYTTDQTLVQAKLVSVDQEGFQKIDLANLHENTRYFPVIYSLDQVGNTSRRLVLSSFVTPPSQILFEEDFEKNSWQRVTNNRVNLWHLTTERFSKHSQENATRAYRFGRPGVANYETENVVQNEQGHIVSSPINIQGFGGLELEMDWFMAGDFVFDFLHGIVRTNLEGFTFASTKNTFNDNYISAWQKLKISLPELQFLSFRLDFFFTTGSYRLANETEGAYIDNIKIRGSRPVVIFPDPTIVSQ